MRPRQNVRCIVYTRSTPASSLTSIDNEPASNAVTTAAGNGYRTSASVPAAVTSAVAGQETQPAVRLAGAVEEDTKNGSNPVDLSTLTRNSYIILDLLAAVVLLLSGVAVLVVRSSHTSKGYRAVPNIKSFEGQSGSYYSQS
ncbi:hypothetical protein C8Q77DRAFT_1073048 [Trametes polyzona]|nr:hypothetical protein C8Q77DRAFT_1073048 [Trametes polyzona]